MKGVIPLDPAQIRDISPLVLDDRGRLKVMPSQFWATTTPSERTLFGHQHGVYGFPTTELVDHLKRRIAGRTAIEIGAGHGVLADALGIPGTDSRQQARGKYKKVYAAAGQNAVTYGRNIIPRDAAEAVRRYEPQVVIASWVTHRYEPARHYAGGNEVGVDEEDVLAHCDEYIHIGNDQVHEHKKIWNLPHYKDYPDFVYSRASNGSRDFLAIWPGRGNDFCDGIERNPNPCRCPCEGCRHHCGAHALDDENHQEPA